MNRVIVTIRLEGSQQAHDLELPADVGASQLCDFLTTAVKWGIDATIGDLGLEIDGEPPRRLSDKETLADAGVWDGSQLLLRASIASPPRKGPLSQTELKESGGVIEWRPIYSTDLDF